jgi:NAD(P)-dependent dehydrogenase (short-subunit alcohol dehydrogenase family)
VSSLDGDASGRRATAPSLTSLDPSTLFDLRGTVGVVTGASGGIGRWLAAGLAAAGAAIVLTDIDASLLEEVSERLDGRGATTASLVADLMDPEAPRRIVQFAVERFGRLDTLINNAGANRRLPMLEVDDETLDLIWTVNFRRPYVLAQEAARVMVEQRGGSIISISSLNSASGIEDLSVYGPTKAAISQLTRVMAVEWARHGIRANAIAPGFLATPMNAPHWSHPTRAPWIMDRIPMRRPGLPHELIGTCLLLASRAGSYITGQTLFVDGGFMAGGSWNEVPGAGLSVYQETGGYGLPPTPDASIFD